MASILDRWGIKEVADVTFYKITDAGTKGDPVLYLDTLKVSTLEQTAETTDARGGKGNAKLVTWDYGKEINVTLQDALFSAKSLSIMYGYGGRVEGPATTSITRSAMVRLVTGGKLPDYFVGDVYDATNGSRRQKIWGAASVPAGSDGVAFESSGITSLTWISEDGTKKGTIADVAAWGTALTDMSAGQKVILQYTMNATTRTIHITADEFPGTYYIQGDTYVRSDVNGDDQFFQFIIPKAKVTSENTITLEADGDPAVFDMNLVVLRPEDGEMMKLVQYDLNAPASNG